MDILTLTKSKTRQKILQLYSTRPDQDYYLRQLERELKVSAANIRRELIFLVNSGLFTTYKKGRLLYYKIITESPLYMIITALSNLKNHKINSDIISDGFSWITSSGKILSPEYYCQTRDIFQARLQTYTLHVEQEMGNAAYLLSAVAGEIGNNSFDHNLGSWPNIPGVYFGSDGSKKTIVLADRGQGIFNTIRRVVPDVKNDKESLEIAFTKTITGRVGEKRGNGLKFVSQIIRDNNWNLCFYSGRAMLGIHNGRLKITGQKRVIKGCFTVIRYEYDNQAS